MKLIKQPLSEMLYQIRMCNQIDIVRCGKITENL